jgi:hypothetical protein
MSEGVSGGEEVVEAHPWLLVDLRRDDGLDATLLEVSSVRGAAVALVSSHAVRSNPRASTAQSLNCPAFHQRKGNRHVTGLDTGAGARAALARVRTASSQE